MPEYWGTGGADTMTGSGLGDSMFGLGGDDVIYGEGGADLIEGGDGDDRLEGGEGDDVLTGGSGADYIDGLGGADTARYSGASTDFYFYRDEEGVTIGDVVGEEGFDQLINVEFFYFEGDDVLLSIGDLAAPGTEGDDVIVGSYLMEELVGRGGDDTLYGGGGRDYLFGGAGADLMYGGTGDDDYEVDDLGDVVVEDAAAGDDSVLALIDYTLPANVETLVLFGDATTGIGNAAANLIWANSGLGSHLQGLGGDDTLQGQSGDDLLDGGAGADVIAGGAGADSFVYRATADSGASAFDTIEDFLPGTDMIDLGLIDADPATAADDAFTYIGSNAFTAGGASSAGELRVFLVAGQLWQAEGDADGDGAADLVIQIVIDGAQPLTASDFIL